MRVTLILFSLLCNTMLVLAQVGVNTTEPKATMDIQIATTDGTTAEGLIVPRLTLSQLVSKDSKYALDQTGALVYVTDASGTNSTKTKKVIAPGYYSFDGTIWQSLTPDQSLRFFYMPSVLLPTDASDPSYNAVSGSFSIDLYQAYSKQFGLTDTGSSVKSPGATSMPVLQSNAFEYFITYYDNSVFQNVSLSNTGVLTYKLPSEVNVSDKTFMNIIFKLK